MGLITSELPYTRADDLSTQRQPRENSQTGESSPFLGTWYNTDRNSGSIVEAVLSWRDGKMWLRVFGAGATSEEGKKDLGEVEARPYLSNNPGSNEDEGFLAEYDFDFMTMVIAANQKRGILVLECFNRYRDSSGRGDYFAREFYHQLEG